jgi:hypothetical protein
MRAYGLGVCLILLAFGLLWRVTTSPSITSAVLATVVSLCAVHTLYHNAILLFAIGVAGIAVAVRNRLWNRALLLVGIGLIAAVSMIPYLLVMKRAKNWNMIMTRPDFGLSLFWAKLSETLSSAGYGLRWLWVILVIAAVVTAVVAHRHAFTQNDAGRRDLALFCATALFAGILAYYAFLRSLSYVTQPWYYVPLIALVAVAVEGMLSAIPWSYWKKEGRTLLSITIALWSLLPTWKGIHIRQTNIDMVAAKLEGTAKSGDAIVVVPWFLGVSFARYYRGSVGWLTVPPVNDHRVHRYDLFKEQMAAINSIDPVLAAMADALKTGGRVWVVGGVDGIFGPPNQAPPSLAPAPHDPVGWNQPAYSKMWSMQVATFVRTHAKTAELFASFGNQPTNPHEKVPLIKVDGWQSP